MAKDVVIDSSVTGISGKIAKGMTNVRFKGVMAKPTAKAVMHNRAGQMRYSKSTRRNARVRLRNKKENYSDKWENSISATFSSFISYLKRKL